MVKLKVESVKDKYVYKLVNDINEEYQFNLEFVDLETLPKENDYIYMSAELLNPRYAGYSTLYTFENLEHKCGKANITLDDIDVIKLVVDNKEIYLKRLYG